MPHPLHEGSLRRQKQVPYDDLGDYMNGLALCDQIIQRSHDFTRWFHHLPRRDQDFIYDCLTEWAPAAPGSQPSLGHHFCFGIIAVMMARHQCTAPEALTHLPASVREFCEAHGFER